MEKKFNKQKSYASHYADDEIDFVHLFFVIWKRKVMIFAVTFVLTFLAFGLSLIMPKIYEVVTILEPIQDAEGRLAENPQNIRENILRGSYDWIIAEKFNLSLSEVPTFKVSIPRETNLVMISIESGKPQQAVTILETLLTVIAEKIQMKLETSKEILRNELKIAITEEQSISKNILLVEDMIRVAEQNIKEMESRRIRTNKLSSNEDSMATLIFLSQIQSQLELLNVFQEKLLNLFNYKQKITIDINNLRLKLASIKGVDINKQPNIPDEPIKPNKKLIMVLTFLFGLIGGVLFAFLADFISKERQLRQIG